MKSVYEIRLAGCDGTTYLFVFLNEAQAELIKNLSKLSKEISTFPCEPTMSIKKGNM